MALRWALFELPAPAAQQARGTETRATASWDCLSFLVMEKRGIREAWAVDEDFTHRFVARPGPLQKR